MVPPVNPTTSSRPSGAERAQRVGHQVGTDDVHHHVDAPAAGQLLHRREEAVDEHHLVGAGRAGHLALLLRRDHGDRARAVAPGDLDRRGPHATGRAVHQHRLVRAQPGAGGERELGGQVVHRQRRAGLERHRVREREHAVRAERDDLRTTAVRQHAGDPVARREAGAVRRGAHHPGEVDAELEGRLGLELVLTPRQQQVGEAGTDGLHLHDDVAVAGRGLGDVDDLDAVGTVEAGDVECAHDATLARARRAPQPAARTMLASSKCMGSV